MPRVAELLNHKVYQRGSPLFDANKHTHIYMEKEKFHRLFLNIKKIPIFYKTILKTIILNPNVSGEILRLSIEFFKKIEKKENFTESNFFFQFLKKSH